MESTTRSKPVLIINGYVGDKKNQLKKNKGFSAPHIFKIFCIQVHSFKELKNMVLQHMFDFKIREKSSILEEKNPLS